MTTVRRHGNVGELCAFGLRDRRTYTVTAMETTEMMSLSKESLLTQLGQLCPNVVEDLRRRVSTKYRRLRRVTTKEAAGHESSPKSVARKVVGILETIMSSTVASQDSCKVVPETTTPSSPSSSSTTRRGDMVASDVEDFVLSNQEEKEEEEENPAVDETDSEEEEECKIVVKRQQQQQIQYEKLSQKVDAMYDLLRVIAENTKNSASIRNHVTRGSSGPM